MFPRQPRAPENRRRADSPSIIAVTGLGGHAYGSWSHSDERMWLRDYLPKDAPNARILTYGYQSALQSDSISFLEDHTNKFVHKLVDMRDASEVSRQKPCQTMRYILEAILTYNLQCESRYVPARTQRNG